MSSIIALRAQIENITASIHCPQTQRMVFISNLSLLSGWGSVGVSERVRARECVEEENEMKGKVVCFCKVIAADAADIGGLPWTFLSHPLPLAEGDLRAVLKTDVYILNAEALGADAAAPTLVSVDTISMHCV